ncbi:linker for activation of T-cells family member 2 isoform X2 [Lathamus discolor]|uniref:linker for activation of T-cells family member 2 isoform X2 n=1 Tax=Lathamus discolor TaxID=678569 RepID=UPI0032B72237
MGADLQGHSAFQPQQAECGQAMVQMELLWAAAALMLLGAAISLCAKCQRSATKQEKQLNEQRSQLRSHQSFEVIRSHATMTRRLEQVKEPENLSIVRKTTKELGATRHAGYEDCLQGDDAYVEPISLDYYNSATFFTPPKEKEEDSHSYQNIIIGASQGSDLDDAADYENSSAIYTWQHHQAEALQTESLDDEPDYVNTAPASGPAPLSKQRSSFLQKRNWQGRGCFYNSSGFLELNVIPTCSPELKRIKSLPYPQPVIHSIHGSSSCVSLSGLYQYKDPATAEKVRSTAASLRNRTKSFSSNISPETQSLSLEP